MKPGKPQKQPGFCVKEDLMLKICIAKSNLKDKVSVASDECEAGDKSRALALGRFFVGFLYFSKH
jgi:hypothetical protein